MDLAWSKIQFPLRLFQCAIPDKIVLNRASIRALNLQSSHIKGLEGDGLNVERDILLSDGFRSEGEVWLRGASIGGTLDCHGGRFIHQGGIALTLQDAKIGNSVLLNTPFEAEGLVSLNGTVVHGGLDCSGGKFCGDMDCDGGEFMDGDSLMSYTGHKVAIDAEEIQVDGSVLLSRGFEAKGVVFLGGANIGNDLECSGGRFINPQRSTIDATSARIKGDLLLEGHCEINGRVILRRSQIDHALVVKEVVWDQSAVLDLTSAKARTFLNTTIDQLERQTRTWPSQNNLLLHGFTFDELDVEADLTAQTQIDWIKTQPQDPFGSQAYEQMAKVFRDMGLKEEAIKVMIAKNNGYARHAHGVEEIGWYDVLGPRIAFGYRSFNAFYASLAMIALGYCVFRDGKRRGVVIPTKRRDAYEDKDQVHERYPNFSPFIYSLETFIPLVKMGVAEYWMPNANQGKEWPGLRQLILKFAVNILFGRPRYWFHRLNYRFKFPSVKAGAWFRIYLFLHIAFGWFFTSLWVAGLTGLIRP
jgi:hypothetical protein